MTLTQGTALSKQGSNGLTQELTITKVLQTCKALYHSVYKSLQKKYSFCNYKSICAFTLKKIGWKDALQKKMSSKYAAGKYIDSM